MNCTSTNIQFFLKFFVLNIVFHMHFWCTKKVHQTCIKSAKVHQKCLSFFPGFIPFKKKNNEKFFKDPFNFVINLALKVKQGSHWDFFDISFLRPATGLSGFHSNPGQTLWGKGPRSTQSRLIQQSLVQCSVLETRYEKCNVVLLASIPDLPSSTLNLPKTFSFSECKAMNSLASVQCKFLILIPLYLCLGLLYIAADSCKAQHILLCKFNFLKCWCMATYFIMCKAQFKFTQRYFPRAFERRVLPIVGGL